MTNNIDNILEFHGTRSFGSGEGLAAAQAKARSIYQNLSEGEINELIASALESYDPDGGGTAEDILQNLACLRPGSLQWHHKELVDREIFYPALIYEGAGPEIAASIVQKMSEDNTNHMLCALAWIGNEVICEAFATWRDNPPLWASDLYVPPHVYAQEAGWELTDNGKRRDLFLRECHPLVRSDNADALPDVFAVTTPAEGSCGWCNRPMTTLIDFDLNRPELGFLGLDGIRLKIDTCDICTCYGMVFTKIDLNGGVQWHPSNEKPDYLPDDGDEWPRMPENALVFGSKPRHWIEAADWCVVGNGSSQVGGHPTWVQDGEYPTCPDCNRLMTFIAQVDQEDLGAEGIYYMFICRECNVAATHYQQT